jgi:Na+-translocating ferredoxin:NAD+ oxidoreductase RnfC subunit
VKPVTTVPKVMIKKKTWEKETHENNNKRNIITAITDSGTAILFLALFPHVAGITNSNRNNIKNTILNAELSRMK